MIFENTSYHQKVYTHGIKRLAMLAMLAQLSMRDHMTPIIYLRFCHLLLHDLTLYNRIAGLLSLCCMPVRISMSIAVVEWDGYPSFD